MTGFDNLEHASLTDVGVRRSHNQDNCGVLLATDEEQWRAHGHVFLVADGMGAHAVGELASELAVSIIPHTYHKYSDQGPSAALRKAFIEANTSIHARGQRNREFEGMGTTTTALLLRPEGAWIGHVGDSRAYRIRDGQIEQLSFDHSLIWEYARRQGVSPDDVQGIPPNVIIRSLGPEPLVQVDIEGPYPLRDGDIFVLCSDGLSGQLTDHEIGAVASALPPAEACRFLVDLANLRGGPDNITVVIVRVGSSVTANGRPSSEAAPPRGWSAPIPWPLAALFAGALLAAGATALTVAQRKLLGVLTFLLAAAVIIAGLVGLMVHYVREKRRAEREFDYPPPKAHTCSPCRIERPLLDRLVRATHHLKQQLAERQWEVQWAAYQEHHDRAEGLLTRGDLNGAFGEYCRAMRPLTEALERQRNKEEVFQPVWDRTPD